MLHSSISIKKSKKQLHKGFQDINILINGTLRKLGQGYTMTLAAISCESWQTSAVEMSSGICTSCILVAIMAAVAAFIDI